MKIIKKIGAVIFVICTLFTITFFSCKKGVLDVTDPNVFSADNYPATIDDLNMELNDVYGRFRAGYYDADWYRFFALSRDHSADQAFKAIDFDAATQINFTKTDQAVAVLWEKHYENIAKCINALNDIDRYRIKNPSMNAADKERVDLIEGQVRFARAWNYMILVNSYGETMITTEADKAKMGVPIITKLASVITETQVPRSTIGEVWTYIIDDLKASEAILKTKTWSGNDIARASGWTVKAMLGKAYVYSQQWALASAKLKEVIDGSGKSLIPFDQFKDMFSGKNEFSNESLFELNVIKDESQGWSVSDNVGTRLNIYLAPAVINEDGSTGKNGFGNYFVHDKNLFRFGFTGTAVTPAEQKLPAYLAQSRTWRDSKTVDPRLWVYSFQPYLDSLRWDNVTRPAAKMPGDGVNLETNIAWCFQKYVLRDAFVWSNNISIGHNMYILRLAEVYLLYAEALTKTGQNVNALEYINKVHRRAYGQANVDIPGIYDYASLTAATEAPDAALRNDPLKYEKWAELFAEGTWWFDVCRWKLGQNEADFYQKVATGNLTWNDNKYTLPIPLREMNTNALMKQNSGY